MYATNIGAKKYIKEILVDIKGEINNTVIVGVFNTPLQQWIDHPNKKSTRQQ